jgi:F-type H+-transporting ATPase subunit b
LTHTSLQARFVPRPFFRLFLLIAVAVFVGVSFSPCLARAQESAAPAQTAVTSSAPESATRSHVEEKKTEEEDHNQYLQAPVVQTLARILHLKVETASRLFQIINAAIILLVIIIPIGRRLPKLLRKRSQKLRSDLESARKVTEDANARLGAVEAKLANLGQEIAKFRSEVEQQIAQDEQRGKTALEEESARIVASAEQEISVAAAQAKRVLRHFAADLAIQHATKQLVLTPEADRALISEFVSETAKGGQN